MLRSFVTPEEGRFGYKEGQGLVEYALIIALVALVLVPSLMALSDPVTGLFGKILNALNTVLAPM